MGRQDEFLSPRQVEEDEEFPYSRAQLANWRLLGIGPVFIKGPGENGRILYRRSSLREFLNKHTVSHGAAA